MICQSCQKQVERAPGVVGRSETCLACGADLHACRQCEHFDRGSANDCRESQAEKVFDKERANFCIFFSARPVSAGGFGASPIESFEEKRRRQREAAEALFRKK